MATHFLIWVCSQRKAELAWFLRECSARENMWILKVILKGARMRVIGCAGVSLAHTAANVYAL